MRGLMKDRARRNRDTKAAWARNVCHVNTVPERPVQDKDKEAREDFESIQSTCFPVEWRP